jgi:hypothetical protein
LVVVVQEEQAVQVLVELVTNQYFQAQPQAAGLVEILILHITVAMVVQVVERMEVGLIMVAQVAQTVEMVVVPDLHQAGQDKELQPKLQ